MDDKFLLTVQEQKNTVKEYDVWNKKIKSFFDGFSFLNSPKMISEQIQKLTHVGVRSLNESSELVKNSSLYTINHIDNVLNDVTSQIKSLNDIFNKIQNSFNAKQGFFSKKKTSDVFLDTFNQEYEHLNSLINILKLKNESLISIKDELKNFINLTTYQFLLLDKDATFLNNAKEFFLQHKKEAIKNAYFEIEFDVNQIHTDILTQQQVIFQKYVALNMMLENVVNCIHNVNYITRITSSCVLNMVEINHIIQLNAADNVDNSFFKLKDSISNFMFDLKNITTKPFVRIQ